MTAKSQKYIIMIVTVVAALIVIGTYIINGAEKDDAWLYLVSLIAILSIPVLTRSQK